MSSPIDKIGGASDYYAVPSDFEIPSSSPPDYLSNPNEIFTEIESFNLEVYPGEYDCGDQRVPSTSTMSQFTLLSAGPNAGPAAYPGYVSNQGLRSIGIVQQEYTVNYPAKPAKSFFNIFVNAYLPGESGTFTANTFPVPSYPASWPVPSYPYGSLQLAQLSNGPSGPLIIENTNVTSLPPAVVYIHGETEAVPVYFVYNNGSYWNAGDLFGWLLLAGHGVLSCTNDSTGGTNSCRRRTAARP